MEKKFLIINHDPEELRVIIILGSVFYMLFLFIDFILFREYLKYFLLIRCGIFMPVTAAIFALSFTQYYEKYSYLLFIIIALMSAGGIITMEYIVRDSQYAGLYFYGVSLVIIFFYGTGKVKSPLSLITGIIITVPAIFVDAVYVETDFKVIITKSFFLVFMVAAGNFTGGIIQLTSRSSFLKQCRIEELSMTDYLTGLKNRLFFDSIIKQELVEYIKIPENLRRQPHARVSDRENAGCCYWLILLDIDYFKKVNDKFGHETGDLFLQEFSKRIKNIIRSDDIFIRWGGEEFLLLFRHTRHDVIRKLSNRIKEEISDRPFILKLKEIRATVSGGVLLVPPKSENILLSIENMIDLTDKALYNSKNSGRNRFTECSVQKNASGGVDCVMKPLTV